jgi:hypothetical protein
MDQVIWIYSPERSIADAFRLRSEVGTSWLATHCGNGCVMAANQPG